MNIIASAKLRKAQLAVVASKPYSDGLKRLLNRTLPAISADQAFNPYKAKAINDSIISM